MNATETTEQNATENTTPMKWTTGANLGPRMCKQFNDAMSKLRWAAKGVKELRGIHGKPETQIDHGCVRVAVFGGPTHPELETRLREIFNRYNGTIGADNYKAAIADIHAATEWFNANPMIDDKRETQEEHDARVARYAQAVSEQDRKEAERQAAERIIVGELRAKYPWAKQDGSDYVRLASNLKRLLGDAFPGVLFSCTSETASMMSAVRVKWTNGPTNNEVEQITKHAAYGRFDGMNDSYNHHTGATVKAWRKLFGSAKYVTLSRDTVDLRQPVIDGLRIVCDKWEACGQHSLHEVAYRLIAQTSFPAGAVVTGVEQVPDMQAAQLEDFYRITFDIREVPPAPSSAPLNGTGGITVSLNAEKGGIEIRFPSKPGEEMINKVKSQGFRWSRFGGCWWTKDSTHKRAFAYALAGETPLTGATISETLRDPGEDAADRWAETQAGL